MRSFRLPILILLSCCGIVSCTPENPSKSPLGIWRGELKIDSSNDLPFVFSIDSSGSGLEMTIHNGSERLRVPDLVLNGDSLFIPMMHFDSEFRIEIFPEEMKGVFEKNYRENYLINFSAKKGETERFKANSKAEFDISGIWEVHFEDFSENGIPARGEFSQQGNHVTGTFITHTGDYRYLEGIVDGKQLKLSTFDGEHAFLFVADYFQDTLNGVFLSGTHWKENWQAIRNPNVQLPSPTKLSKVTNPEGIVDFSFPAPSGRMVSLDDKKYKGKPVIIQILGTWCPNCMDESIFLGKWYSDREPNYPEVLGLAFERKNDLQYAGKRIKKTKETLKLDYEILFAGPYQKDSATARLPFIDKVISYPTLVFLDSSHHIKVIHTGFSGPGTGQHFERFKVDFKNMVESIVD